MQWLAFDCFWVEMTRGASDVFDNIENRTLNIPVAWSTVIYDIHAFISNHPC